MDVLALKLAPRTVTGKKVKVLRRQGIVPVHMYGYSIAPMDLQAEAKLLRRILPRVGTNIPLSVETDGGRGESICFVREVQRHPVTEELLHVDFMRVDVSQTMQAEVPIALVGMAPAVRHLGGILVQPLQSILVESLPMNIPASIPVDISVLDDFEKAIHVSDLAVASNVAIVNAPGELIVRVSPPRIEAVEAPAVGVAAEEAEAPAAEEAAAEDQEAIKTPRGRV